MKHTIIILFLSAFSGMATAQTDSASANFVADGFKGCSWGTPLRVMVGKFELKELPDHDTLSNERNYITNVTSLAGVPIVCIYKYYKKYFCEVFITASGYDNFQKLKKAMKEVYGSEHQPNQYMQRFIYNNQYYSETSRILDYCEITDKITLLMYSHMLYKQKEKDDTDNAKKAKSDF